MTIKKDLYVFAVDGGKKKIRKIKLKKLIDNINLEVWTKKFFINEKEAKEYIKND